LSPPVQAQPAPSYGAWGFDLSGRDTSVRPGDDFGAYASGTYLHDLKIPPDQSRWGVFNILRDLSDNRVHAILEDAAAKAPVAPTTDDAKIGAFYKAFMDVQAVDAKGVSPMAPALAAIQRAQSREALAAIMGHANSRFEGSIFNVGVSVDLKDPTAYAVSMSQGGLGLPDRDYYLEAKFAAKKAAYQAYVARLLELAGWPEPAARAADVLPTRPASPRPAGRGPTGAIRSRPTIR
jgi:putative endopeptidase